MTKNRRELGDDFEDRIIEKLGPGFSKTPGSGSVFKNGDIKHRNLVVECKFRSDDSSLTMPKKEYEKLHNEANKQGKDWLYIKQINKSTKPFIVMDLDTFLEMTEAWREKYSYY